MSQLFILFLIILVIMGFVLPFKKAEKTLSAILLCLLMRHPYHKLEKGHVDFLVLPKFINIICRFKLYCFVFFQGVCCEGGQACCPLGFSCSNNKCVSKYGKSEAVPTKSLGAGIDVKSKITLSEPAKSNSTCKTKTVSLFKI